MRARTPTPWTARIWRNSGRPDTVCIKDARGREIVGWNGFDGTPCTKQEVRANAAFIALAVNSHQALIDGFRVADMIASAAIDNGFYVGDGLIEKLAKARAALESAAKGKEASHG